jgi:hypothetical protein
MRAAFAAGPHPSQVHRRSHERIPGLQRLARANAALLFSEKHSDLVFVVKASGERIPAHKNLLSASSEHMAALLDGPWAENAAGVDGGVPVTEVGVDESGVAVRALLRYIYTSEVDEAALATDLADVLGLASQHAQAGLVAACEEHAVRALTLARVVQSLVQAHLHDLAALKAACVELIKANMAAVTMSPAFMRLKSTHPVLWREIRAAMGLPEVDEGEEEGEEEEEQEGGDRKRARK